MEIKPKQDSIPQCFISYSWDNDSHKDWVRELAEKLQKKGVSIFLDQWDTYPGLDLLSYMEASIRKSQFVLLICTPAFCKKANERSGGVGYEGGIITGEMFSKTPSTKKFVPILSKGKSGISLPSYLKSRVYLDFREKKNYKKSFEKLLRHIHDIPEYKKPDLGKRPDLKPNTGARKQKKKVIVKKKTQSPSDYENNVFLNSPLSIKYIPLFLAQIFTVIDCGFIPRTIMEDIESRTSRINKIFAIISNSKYAIHDISPIIDKHSLPKFNMPFELGIFLAIQRLETSTTDRRYSLIIEKDKYRYSRYLSDIAGMDIHSHNNDPIKIISIIRNWFFRVSGRKAIPSATLIYKSFRKELSQICKKLNIQKDAITFADYSIIVRSWLEQNR